MNMFAKELTYAGHTKKFTVSEADREGWEVKVEQDSRIVQRVKITDWHRVERAVSKFSVEASQLERNGWTETEHEG